MLKSAIFFNFSSSLISGVATLFSVAKPFASLSKVSALVSLADSCNFFLSFLNKIVRAAANVSLSFNLLVLNKANLFVLNNSTRY